MRGAGRLALVPCWALVPALALTPLWALAGEEPTHQTSAPLSEATQALPPAEALSRTLASRRYQFCGDPRFPLSADELVWCDQLPRAPDARAARCPQFLVACQAGPTARRVRIEAPFKLSLPAFGGLGRVLFWALAAAAIATLMVGLVRQAWGAPLRRRQPRDDETAPPPPDSAAAEQQARAVERDVDRLLARARAAAARGDHAAAVEDLYAALLRRLEGDGHLRIHPSATNGEYLRALRGKAPTLAGAVADVVSDVEAAEFGARAPDDDLYRALLRRVQPLVGRASAGAVIGLAALTALATSCQTPLRPDWAASPSGTAAVSEFLTTAGVPTRPRLHPLRQLDDAQHGATQIVLLPNAELGDAEWSALHDWVSQPNKTLVLATGPRSLPDWLGEIEFIASGAGEPLRATRELSGRPGPSGALEGRIPGAAWVRLATAKAPTLITRGQHAYAAELALDPGRVVVLADDRLLTNAALPIADNAELLLALLHDEGGPVDLVGEETGLVAPNPVAAVARGRLAPFMAQLGAFLILFLLMQGRAFGRLVDRNAVHRRAFAEHVRALGTQYARARAAGHVAGAYATWAIERLRERIRSRSGESVGDLSAAVAARTGRPLGDVARLLFSARPDAGGASRPATIGRARTRASVEHSLDIMRQLHGLLAESSADRRPPSQEKSRP